MIRVFGRLSLAVCVAVVAVVGTSISPGHGGAVARNSVFAAPQYGAAGVSAAVAARSLNALARKENASTSKSLTNVHFILNWLPNVEFAGLWMAQKFNWWQKAGIKMTFTPWSNGITPEVDVPARGGDTFGFQSGAAIVIGRSRGEKITALYTDTQKSVFGLTVLKKSHITSLKQLKGKKVGYQSHELYVPQTMLSSAGLKSTDWTPVPVGFNIDYLTAGRVDAYEVFVTNEPISLQMQHIPITTFPAYKFGFHSYDDVLFTYNGLMQTNPALVAKVTKIVAQAFQYGHTHAAETARYVTQTTYPASAAKAKAAQNLEQQTIEMKDFAPYSKDASGRYTGLMATPYWQDLINTLYKYQLIKSKPSAASIYTNRFNPYK